VYHFPQSSGTVRDSGGVKMLNLITRAQGAALSLASAELDGAHPASVSQVSDRVYYIIEGEARFEVGVEAFSATAGDAVLVPKQTTHEFEGTAKYLVVNVPPYDPAAEESGS
jgi:mannose-6-phosphate isomerase-like protein (cupin superfamily)